MELDVVDLRDFYQTPLGLTVRRIVGGQVGINRIFLYIWGIIVSR